MSSSQNVISWLFFRRDITRMLFHSRFPAKVAANKRSFTFARTFNQSQGWRLQTLEIGKAWKVKYQQDRKT